MNRWLLVALIVLGAGASLFWAFPQVLLDPDSQMRLLYLLLVLAVVLGGTGWPRGRIKQGLRDALLWLGIFLVVMIGYSQRENLRDLGRQFLGDLIPARATASDDAIVIVRGQDGHFNAVTMINGHPVFAMIDTGASDVVIPFHEARRIGIDTDALRFSIPVSTANGQALIAPITLTEISIGDLRIHNIRAAVSEPARLNQTLLGMSFLSKLHSVTVQGDRMYLVPYNRKNSPTR